MTVFKVTFPGSLPAGDIFQFGWHCTSTLLDATALAANADDWLNGFLSGGSPAAGDFNTGVVFNSPQVQELDAGGGVVATAYGSATGAGTNSNESLPNEVAVCVTLRTALSGASHRGRFYLPCPQRAALTAAGRLTSTMRASLSGALADAWVAFLSGTTDVVIVVRSGTLAATFPCTSFEIGDVFDAQRRRRNKLLESRLSAPL